MIPWTPTQLLLKHASGHKSSLGIPTSRWAEGQVHSKAEVRKPWHVFIHSLGEEVVQILKLHLNIKFLKNCHLISKGIILKKFLSRSLEVFFEAVRAFCFDFDVSTNRKNAKIEMKLLDLVVCFHNYSCR